MTPERWTRVQAIFLDAEALPPERREGLLSQLCAGDAGLRSEVEALLSASADTVGVLDRPPATGSAATAESLAEGTRLGPWLVEQLIGRGGMGEVYAARRADGAFEMRAAVKLLKRGLDTDAVLRRFLRERRILAQLSHPNIAHLLDAGRAADGRPYLVLEFVDGQTITGHAHTARLSTPEMLRLMITVCDAVQSAHRQQIVHRDLKPSNVMVTAAGQVKLLDFGIAKLMTEDDADATRLAGEGMPLTPAYAAPEQLLGQSATPASDVYALGVMLYQLLAGCLPHRREGKSTTAITHDLKNETIPRPSLVLRRERGRLPETERQQRLKEVSGDLDLIVLKALNPEAGRRYPSAQQFSDDLQRLLDHRPIQARPDSLAYRIGRLVRRNRLAVSAAAAIIAALSLGLAASLMQAQAALLARNDATHRRQQADGLINFMLGDLKEQLEPVGRLDVLDAAASKVMDYLAGEDAARMDDTALAQRIRALMAIADVRDARNQLAPATQTAQQAVQAARELRRRKPENPEAEYLLASALQASVNMSFENGRMDDTRAPITEGKQLIARVLSGRPQDADAVHVDALFRGFSANLYSLKGDHAQALHEFQACADEVRPLIQQAEVKPAFWRLYFECKGAAVNKLSAIGAVDKVVPAYQELLAEERAALAKHPNNIVLLEQLQGDFSLATDNFLSAGRIDLAQESAHQAVEFGRQLTAHDPSNGIWKHSLGVALWGQCQLAVAQADWPALEHSADEEIAVFEDLLPRKPQDAKLRTRLMSARAHRALGRAGQHNIAGALADWEADIALAVGNDSTVVQLETLSAHLHIWELLTDSKPARAQTARAAAQKLLDHFTASGTSLRDRWKILLTEKQMRYAYLSGDLAAGDQHYATLRDANSDLAADATQSRRRLCTWLAKRKGPHCVAIREWKPPEVPLDTSVHTSPKTAG